ncbi:MAG: FHA domain-containing protein [Anaerolineales bacterium]
MDRLFSSQNETLVQEFDFGYPVLNIGSHPDNDIVLPGENALAFHATLHMRDGQFHLIALGGASSIRVNGKPLTDSPAVIQENQQIEIGNYMLAFRQNGSPESIHVSLAASSFPAASNPTISIPQGENPILVNAPVELAEIDVEQTASYELEIINGGPIVAAFFVTLSGVSEEWVEINPRMVNLNEGQRARVRIDITPPRDPSSAAGKHPLQVQVQSPNYGGHSVQKALALVIRPYYEFTIGSLAPKDQRISWGKRTGKSQLPIINRSNSAADFNLTAVDDENGCVFDLLVNDEAPLTRQATVGIPAGETYNLPVQITPHKRHLFAFSSKRYPYTTTVQSPQGSTQMTSGSVSAVPLFGWWSIVLTVLLVGLGLFLLLQPNIYNFHVAAGKDIIELGDSTRLEWSVSPFATNVSISGIDQAINRGQTSLTLAPNESTTYEIIASNWLSGLLRMDQRRSITVLVVPPTPRINVFEVGETSLARGKPVMLRWSVTRAEQAFLTIDEVVYELPRNEFSGEREVVLDKDALVTIEARNASGSELRSYFVNVVEPEITVRAFTVWVRPQGSAFVEPSRGGNKTFSILSIPDPNFPQKYVELVPDRNSDTGYRVEFYQPDRELSKGEQVMIEWNIEGTDSGKIQIAPFTEALPARGSQPFFPQESMNFVMTAKSGELEELFMLPVKVFDGQPPEAPNIEFFRASPLKAIGASDVQFAWSVSGNWTRVQLATEDKVIADYINPQGFRTIRVTKSGTYILTAWNGNLSSAAPVEITIDPTLRPIGLYFKSAFPATGRFLINDEVSFTLDFYDPDRSDLTGPVPVYVEPDVAPTGTVLVTDGVSLCTINLPAKTCNLKFTTPGDPKEITASYSGDTIYASASTDKPYDQYISVISSTVTLTPTYYLLNRTNPVDSMSISPINLTSSPRTLDTGLFIRVGIAPQGSPLPTPDAGKVNLYLCQQQASGSGWQVVPGSCEPRGFASVTLNPVTGATPAGYADIILDNFPAAGTYAMLFSYSAAGFEPAERIEYNVVISKLEIKLGLEGCSLAAGATCELGTSTPASTKVIFQLLKSNGDRLPAVLTVPAVAAFEMSENIGGTLTPWSCQMAVQTAAGVNYRVLECTVDFTTSVPPGASLRSPSLMTFQFAPANEPNYLAVPSTLNFTLNAKQNTFVSLTASSLSNLKVGQLVDFTTSDGLSGIVQLINASGTKITPTGNIVITASQTGVFPLNVEYPSATAGCTVDAVGQVLTITSISDACTMYFRKVATNLQLTVAYMGNNENYRSESAESVTFSVTKQTDITLNWQHEGTVAGTYTAWSKDSILPNTPLKIRILLGGPTNFSTTALRGGTMRININDSTCAISGHTSGGYPNYNVAISQTGVGQTPRIDFTLTCTTTPRSVRIQAALNNNVDFGIASGQVTEQLLGIVDRSGRYIGVDFTRWAPQDQSVAVFAQGAMSPLHFGERYDVRLTVGRIYADTYDGARIDVINAYLAAGHRAQVRFNAAIFATIDWTRSTCINMNATNANTVGVPLDTYRVVYDFGDPNLNNPGLTDIEMYNNTPCLLYFDTATNTAVTSGGTTQFYFNVSGFTHTTSAYSTQLLKQTVTLSPATANYTYTAFVDSPRATFNLNVTPQNSGTSLNPLVSPIGTQILFPATPTCGITPDSGFVSRILALIGLTPSTAATCDAGANLLITYAGNNWFQSASYSLPVNVSKHNPNMVLSYKQANGNYGVFNTPYPNMKVDDVLDFKVNLAKGADAFTSTPAPGGKVEVWMMDSNGTVLTGAIYEIDTTSAAVTYNSTTQRYEIDLNTSGDALFALTVKGAQANIRLVYRYVGDSYYFAKQQQTEYMEFKPAPAPPGP